MPYVKAHHESAAGDPRGRVARAAERVRAQTKARATSEDRRPIGQHHREAAEEAAAAGHAYPALGESEAEAEAGAYTRSLLIST